MNKRSVRAFALGILLSVSLIGSSNYFLDSDDLKQTLNQESAKELLKKQNYIVLTKSEYEKLKTPTVKKSVPEKKKETPKKKPTTDNSKEKKETKDQPATYTLKIVSGMTPSQISVFLKNANIIEDENKFDSYLTENGYSTKIQLGTFTLTRDMSFEEIAKVITKS